MPPHPDDEAGPFRSEEPPDTPPRGRLSSGTPLELVMVRLAAGQETLATEMRGMRDELATQRAELRSVAGKLSRDIAAVRDKVHGVEGRMHGVEGRVQELDSTSIDELLSRGDPTPHVVGGGGGGRGDLTPHGPAGTPVSDAAHEAVHALPAAPTPAPVPAVPITAHGAAEATPDVVASKDGVRLSWGLAGKIIALIIAALMAYLAGRGHEASKHEPVPPAPPATIGPDKTPDKAFPERGHHER